jgi:hypothetical protein
MLRYLLQDAEDLFDPVAGLNNPGVMTSFHTGLSRTREHLLNALREAQPGGNHEMLCYQFQVGTTLLVALLDGMAVYVEKKVATPPLNGRVYWTGAVTFLDPRFAELRAIQQRTTEYIIKGGISVNSIRNLVKHYLPWLPLSDATGGSWDIRFPIDSTHKSGPLLSGLLFPLFNDARDAYAALGRLIGQAPLDIASLDAASSSSFNQT